VVGADHRPQILGVGPRRQRRRADQIAEQHRQLPTFGLGGWPCGRPRHRRPFDNGRRQCALAQRRDGLQQFPARTDRQSQRCQIGLGQLRQRFGVDFILAKRWLVSRQPQAPQPRRNLHAALAAVEPASLVGFKLTWNAARIVPFHRSLQRPAATTATRGTVDPAATGTAASHHPGG
jgi:hypothetical protein